MILRVIIYNLLVISFLFGATPDQIDKATSQTDQIQRDIQERLKKQYEEDMKSSKEPTKIEVEVPKPTTKKVTVCKEIKTINIKGSTLIDKKVLKSIKSEFEKRCLNVNDIELLLSKITAAYILDGYISSRVYLPQQDLNGGVLEIVVIEGKVEDIILDEKSEGTIFLPNVTPFMKGNPLNVRDLEQTLDQINRLVSNNATFKIEPGSEAGDSILVLENKTSRALRTNLSYDNQGSEYTGEKQFGATVMLDNPLNINDFISYSFKHSYPYTSNEKNSQSDNYTYVVPFGYSTFSINYNESKSASLLNIAGVDVGSKTNSDTRSFKIDHIAYRDQTKRLNISAGLTSKRTDSFLEFPGLTLPTHKRSTILDIDTSLSLPFWIGALSLDLGYAKGLKIMGADKDPSNLPKDAPRYQFEKIKYGYNYMIPFKVWDHNFIFNSNLSGQRSLDPIHGSEQISIGSIYSVRGFDSNSLAGDDGYYIRNELSLRVPFSYEKINSSVKPYIGYDYGSIKNQGELSGGVVGLGINAGIVNFDIFHTFPIDTDAFNDTNLYPNKDRRQTYFRLSIAF